MLIAALVASSACSRSSSNSSNRTTRGESGAAQASEVRPVAVTTARAESREVPSNIEVTGSLTADESSDVASQVSGQVIATPVGVGAFVRQGATIARLSDRDARLRLRQAQAAEQQATAAVRQAEARLGLGPNGRFDASTIPEVRSAAAAHDVALAQLRLAEANVRRYADLVETGDVARSVYDQYRTQADTARAQTNNARQQLETAINQARQNNQAIQSAQAGVVVAHQSGSGALAHSVATAFVSGMDAALWLSALTALVGLARRGGRARSTRLLLGGLAHLL